MNVIRKYGRVAGLTDVTYRCCPVLVPQRIALHEVILPWSEPKGAYEVSFEQEATKETKLCFLRCLLFKAYFYVTAFRCLASLVCYLFLCSLRDAPATHFKQSVSTNNDCQESRGVTS